MSETAAVRAVQDRNCFVCGPGNPRGLRIVFETPEPGRVRANWTASEDWEGFQGVVHGGIISTLLDEAMSKAVASMGWPALTCELRVRLRRPTTRGDAVEARGWVVERARRKIAAEASLCGPDGTERAHAWGAFLLVGGGPPPVTR